MAVTKKFVPFDFVLEELRDLNPTIKPMFGAFGLYVESKIVFILREKESNTEDNGIWLATTAEHHESLQDEFPSMRSIQMFGPGPTGWQILPSDSDDFEESVLKACVLVKRNDIRLGKVPKTKIRKKTKSLKKNGIKKVKQNIKISKSQKRKR